MASRIQGITIEIDGNATPLQNSLKKLDGSLKATQSQLRDVDKLLKLDPKNTELLTQKQKALEKSIKGTELRLNELKTAQEGVAEGSEEWDAIQREIIATEQSLKGLNEQMRDFGSVGAQKIKETGKQILEGEIGIHPYENGDRGACSFCAFKGVCGFDPSLKGYEKRKISKKIQSVSSSCICLCRAGLHNAEDGKVVV